MNYKSLQYSIVGAGAFMVLGLALLPLVVPSSNPNAGFACALILGIISIPISYNFQERGNG